MLRYYLGKRKNGTSTGGGNASTKVNSTGIEELESYLKQKDAAGVAYCKPAIVYIFPTCAFASSLLQQRIPLLRVEEARKSRKKFKTGNDGPEKKQLGVDVEKKPTSSGKHENGDNDATKKEDADETKENAGKVSDEDKHEVDDDAEEDDDEALLMVILDSDQ